MSKLRRIIIAIDGPAASGKSTTAREVANRLGYTYIDSGAMYRAITLKALREKIAVTDARRVKELADRTELRFVKNKTKTRIFMDGEDVSEEIRTPVIDRNISPVAANPLVRKILVRIQQQMGNGGGVVMDGRDIGTVVFPRAELKVFMIASVEERARRRQKEMEQKGARIDFNKLVAEIEYRDRQDTEREHGPLRRAEDAVDIDTTGLSIEEQVQCIVQLAREKMAF